MSRAGLQTTRMSSPSSRAVPATIVVVFTAAAAIRVTGMSGSSAAFLEVGELRRSSDTLALSGLGERPRLAAATEPRSPDFGNVLPFVGFAAAAGLAAAAIKASAVRRQAERGDRGSKYKPPYSGVRSYNQTSLVPNGNGDDRERAGLTEPNSTMTLKEEDAWLATRNAELEELLPLSKEDFDDQVNELTWQWARYLLPFTDKQREDLAQMKRNFIQKQRGLMNQVRLYKPLAMRHPTMLKRMNKMTVGNIQNKNLKVNGSWVKNEETIAGFSYVDFVTATNNNTFTDWAEPQVGDVVSGTVVGMMQDGAFVEVGAKSWALLPTANASLVPVTSVTQVLKIGQEISAKVIAVGVGSKVPGDLVATQIVLSLAELQRADAWNEAERAMTGEEGTVCIFKVTVLEVKPWGATVLTKDGLQGMILNRDLGAKAGDVGMVGTQIETLLLSIKPENKDIEFPMRPDEFPLVFSYKSIATRALAEALTEGMVVEAKIVQLLAGSMEVVLNDVQCTIKKMDMSGMQSFNIADLFMEGEIIKAFVVSADEIAGVRLSTRLLEAKRGQILTDKATVFANAEEQAKKALVKVTKEKRGFEAVLGDTFGEELPAGKAKKAVSSSQVVDDSDDDKQF